MDAIDHAPQIVQDILRQYNNRLLIINENCVADAVFTLSGIRFNIWRDRNNKFGKWQVLFHEIGHAIDYLLGGVAISNDFLEAIKNDFDNTVNTYIAQSANPITREQAFSEISILLMNDSLFSVSDIYGGLTGNKCRGNYIHRQHYWDDQRNIGIEAFAHFFSALVRGNKDELMNLRSAFPTAFAIFEKRIGISK